MFGRKKKKLEEDNATQFQRFYFVSYVATTSKGKRTFGRMEVSLYSEISSLETVVAIEQKIRVDLNGKLNTAKPDSVLEVTVLWFNKLR